MQGISSTCKIYCRVRRATCKKCDRVVFI